MAGWLPSLPSPLDAIWLAALALALVAVAATRRARAPVVAALVLAGGLALLDQSRWQPWAYQYFLMLAALAVAGGRSSRPEEGSRGRGGGSLAREPALATAGLIVAAIYLWSGLSKVGAAFGEDVYPELLEPFFGSALPGALAIGAYAVPVVEAAIGVALLTARGRPYAIVAAVGMHAFILLSLGPLGSDQNSVVWPWNIAMVAFVVAIFRGAPDTFGDLRRAASRWRPEPRRLALGVALLVGVLPALSFVGHWDAYLSASLYSGSNLRATAVASPAVARRWPPTARAQTRAGPDGPALRLYDWSMADLNVPPYPARRVLRSAAGPLCDAAGSPAARGDLVLAVGERPNRLTGDRSVTLYRCKELRSSRIRPGGE